MHLAFRRLAARAASLARQDSGLAAVEFALILPILVVLWFGGVELTQALSVDRRLNNLASAIGDLVARSKIVTYADIDTDLRHRAGRDVPLLQDRDAVHCRRPRHAHHRGQHEFRRQRHRRLEPRAGHDRLHGRRRR